MSKPKRKLSKTKQNPADEVSESAQVPEIPEFGSNLKAERLDREIGGVGDWVRISPTMGLRLKRFVLSFALGFVLAVLALMALYLPDFVADYAHRGDAFLSFFGKFLLTALFFVSICAAISALLKEIVIYVSPSRKCIYQGMRLTDKNAGDAVSLSCIDSMAIEPPGVTKRSRLLANVRDTMAVLGETVGDNQDLITLLQWLKTIQG